LRAAIDWSHELLSEVERTLLRRLSVFSGGFRLEAAETVCAESGDPGKELAVSSCDVFELLTDLVDKSLVIAGEEEGVTRYRFLEMIRQYGREKLKAAGEEERLLRNHRDWCISFAEKAEPELYHSSQDRWLDRIESEHSNIRAAIDWSLRQEEPEGALRIAVSLHRFWEVRAHYDEGLLLIKKSLGAAGSLSKALKIQSMLTASRLAAYLYRFDDIFPLIEESLALSQRLNEKRLIVHSLLCLGIYQYYKTEIQNSEANLERSLTLYADVGDETGVATADLWIGLCAERRIIPKYHKRVYGDALSEADPGVEEAKKKAYQRGTAAYRKVLDSSRAMGDRFLQSEALFHWGCLEAHFGDLDRSRQLLERCLPICRSLKSERLIGNTIHLLGIIAREERKYAEACILLARALRLLARIKVDSKVNLSSCIIQIAILNQRIGKPLHAARLFGSAWSIDSTLDITDERFMDPVIIESMEKAQKALGNEAYQTEWERGRTMTLDDAIEYAVSCSDAKKVASFRSPKNQQK
jgi:non-specific serine/threonine protein kinase